MLWFVLGAEQNLQV